MNTLIDEVDAKYEAPGPSATPPPGEHPAPGPIQPDMERMRRDLERMQKRMERLKAD